MGDIVVIGLVVIVTVAAHIWIYLWVKFKIDEGAILRLLEESGKGAVLASAVIASHINIKPGRVAAVCGKSKGIVTSVHAVDEWCINGAGDR
jgi:hypothetical protein